MHKLNGTVWYPFCLEIKTKLPVFYTPAMRKAMYTKYRRVCPAVKPATVRFLYHDLTGRMIKRSALIEEDTVLFQLLLDALLISAFLMQAIT